MSETQETPGIGHNLPDVGALYDVEELSGKLRQQYRAVSMRCDELLDAEPRIPQEVNDDETSGKVGDFIKQIDAVISNITAYRKAEKAPFLQGGRTVDGFFKSLAEPMEKLRKKCADRDRIYKARKEEEERIRREEEEERKREEAEAARRAAEEEARKAREAQERAEREKAEAERKQKEAQEAREKAEREKAEARAAEERARDEARRAREAEAEAKKRAEQEKLDRKEREKAEAEAKAAREKAEAEAKEAEKKREAARKAEQEARDQRAAANQQKAEAAAKTQEAREVKRESRSAEGEARSAEREHRRAEKDANAGTADLTRTRGEYGSVGGVSTVWVHDEMSLDRDKLDLEKLRQHIPEQALHQAIRSFIKAGGRELAGVVIEEDRRSTYR